MFVYFNSAVISNEVFQCLDGNEIIQNLNTVQYEV